MAVIEAIQSIKHNNGGGGGAASFEFTSIPATYEHLQLVCKSHVDLNGHYGDGYTLWMQIGVGGSIDTNSLYSMQYIGASGTSSQSGVLAETTAFRAYDCTYGQGSRMSEVFGYMSVLIPNYASGNKAIVTMNCYGGIGNSDKKVAVGSNIWNGNSAVTNLKVYPDASALFQVGTQMDLYGIKSS